MGGDPALARARIRHSTKAADQAERARDRADHARVLAVVGLVDREVEAVSQGGGDREEEEEEITRKWRRRHTRRRRRCR
jgi:hypothetical protein